MVIWRVLHLTVRSTINKDVSLLAAGLAFFALISLAPFLIIAVAVGGAIFGAEAAQAEVYMRVSDEIGPEVAEYLVGLADSARDLRSTSIATVASAIVLFWGSTRLFLELRRAINTVWDVPPQAAESWRAAILGFLKGRFVAALAVLVFGAIFLALLGTRVALNITDSVVGGTNLLDLPLPAWAVLEGLLALGLISTGVAIIYKLLPRHRPSGWPLWIGTLATAGLLLAGRFGVALYVSTGTIETAYGAAGSIVVFMIWGYYSSMAFLFGARLTHVIERGAWRRPVKPPEEEPAPRLKLRAAPPPTETRREPHPP